MSFGEVRQSFSGRCLKDLRLGQLFGKVEYRPQKVGERFMLKEIGVLQEVKELALLQEVISSERQGLPAIQAAGMAAHAIVHFQKILVPAFPLPPVLPR